MVDIKIRETNYSFYIPKKVDLIPFLDKFLNFSYIEDLSIYYSPVLKEILPEKFSVNEIESPKKDQLDIFKDIVQNYYLDKKYFDKFSNLIKKQLNEKFPDYPDHFIYLRSILISISFKVYPLFRFPQKERDYILKKQDSNYGISAEIDYEKDENDSDINTDMYSGWIDLRGIDIYNSFRKSQTEIKMPKTSLLVDIQTNSEFLSLFDYILRKFSLDNNYAMVETFPLL